MDAEEPILKVADLTVAYDEVVVLDKVGFEVRRGEILMIVGGSGCGKSTLLKAMIGLLAPRAGSVRLDGDELVGAFGAARKRILRKIGIGYQSGALFGSMSLLDNVRLPLEELTDLPQRALDLVARMKLKLVALEGAAEQSPAELSGGMKKRGAIARALALDPEILFLDEPSAGLDPISSAEMDALVLRLARTLGMTFVIITHEIASIDAIADRVIMLDQSVHGILAMGTPAQMREHADARVRNFFLREPPAESDVAPEPEPTAGAQR